MTPKTVPGNFLFWNKTQDLYVNQICLFLDRKYEAVILPIFGLPTPFHISTIKVSQSSVVKLVILI